MYGRGARDLRNIAALPNSMLADAFSQEGHSNILNPTSPSRTFHSPTKEQNLNPHPLEPGQVGDSVLGNECSASDAATLLK